MSDFAKRLKENYSAAKARKVEVPEWDMVLHVRPLTIGQAARFSDERDDFRRACRIIQVRARDDEGAALFDEDDFAAMVSHGEAELIARIAGAIMASDGNLEAAGKN